MLLLLIRHARAGDRDPDRWPDDTLRPVTNVGREIHAQMSRALVRLECAPEAVLTSPWVRALQTAELMIEEMELDLEPVRCDVLARQPELATLDEQVRALGDVAAVALVGHEPWMSELASLLLTGERDKLAIDFPKSGVLGVDTQQVAPGAAALRLFLRPRYIRDLSRKKKK